MYKPEMNHLQNEELLKVLREINDNPEITQRELSSRLGISLGKINFLLKASIQKGLIKVHNFKKSNNKIAYLYFITPQGLEEKTRTAHYFLKRKVKEYEKLQEEIALLKKETGDVELPADKRD